MPADRPVLYVFFGLIASGKSTLASAFAEMIGCRAFNSDVVRKELAGEAAAGSGKSDYGKGIYSPEFTAKTYAELFRLADVELAAGRSVALDASFATKKTRAEARKLAARHGATVRFILCQASEKETCRRLVIRAFDPAAVSDGRPEIYRRQRETFKQPDELAAREFFRIDTERPVTHLLAELASRLPDHQPEGES